MADYGMGYVGYIPTDVYNDFISNKDLYDKFGKPYPYWMLVIGGVSYKVNFTDPYTIIGYYGPDLKTPISPPATPDPVPPANQETPSPHEPTVPVTPATPETPATIPELPTVYTSGGFAGMGALALLGVALLLPKYRPRKRRR